MIESKCGLTCSTCTYKKEVNCLGCMHMEAPFWGESCPIKDCCKDKKVEHCGRCDIFPCDLLKQFSYDPKQGDDGKRIEQCKKWCLK